MLSQMATLTIVPYKPQRSVIHKPSKRIALQSSSVKNGRFDFTDVPIEKLQSAGATGGSNLQRKTAGDGKPTTHDVQASKDIPARPQASIAEKHDSGDDTDDELPPLSDIFSGSYKRRQALREQERLLRRSILEKSNNEALHNDGSHKSRGSGSYDEPIIFYGDRSKGDSDSLDTELAPCALNSGQPSHDASNLKTPSILSNLTANKRDDDHISKDQDDASDTPNSEAAAVSASIDAGADPAFDLWWDIEDECFVKGPLCPLPPLKQDGFVSTPARDQPQSLHYSPAESQNQINLHDDDRARWSASKEPAPHSLSTIFDADCGDRRDGNASELGKDLLLTCQLSPPQINPPQDRGGPSHSRFKELGQDQEEDEPQERQQQEKVTSEAIGNKDGENGDDVELRGVKRQRRDKTKEISCGIYHPENGVQTHNTTNEDNDGPRSAKRQRKLSASLGDRTASTPPKKQLWRSPSPISEDEEEEWEVRKIIGKEIINGEPCYWVQWASTLEPGCELEHAQKLVDEFEARLQAKRAVNGRGKLGSKRAVTKADRPGSQQQKRPRGRPRKQT